MQYQLVTLQCSRFLMKLVPVLVSFERDWRVPLSRPVGHVRSVLVQGRLNSSFRDTTLLPLDPYRPEYFQKRTTVRKLCMALRTISRTFTAFGRSYQAVLRTHLAGVLPLDDRTYQVPRSQNHSVGIAMHLRANKH